uniref:Uncharacterized protein n=1 Tax=Triticum urartu TaxID=4572 RepID=A0A8R7V5A4_TRIUA
MHMDERISDTGVLQEAILACIFLHPLAQLRRTIQFCARRDDCKQGDLIDLDNGKPHLVEHLQRLCWASVLAAGIDHAGPRNHALIPHTGEHRARFSEPPASPVHAYQRIENAQIKNRDIPDGISVELSPVHQTPQLRARRQEARDGEVVGPGALAHHGGRSEQGVVGLTGARAGGDEGVP